MDIMMLEYRFLANFLLEHMFFSEIEGYPFEFCAKPQQFSKPVKVYV
jgi:hypothetical protein